MAGKRAEQRKQGLRRNVREERRQRAQNRKTRRNIFIGGGTGAVAFVLIAAFILPSLLQFGGLRGATPEESVGEFHRSTGDQHVAVGTTPRYSTTPPTSGSHYDTPAPWGVHEEMILDQQAVHNMEHGGIVINYNLTDPQEVTALRTFVEGHAGYPGCLLMRPYPEIVEGTIALTAWEWLQEFQSVETAGMQEFIDAHINRGPENLGAGCGGTGEMIR